MLDAPSGVRPRNPCMHDADAAHDCAAAQPSYPPRAVAWYATIVLAIMYWLSVLDRFIISLLVGPIKADLGLSATPFGMQIGRAAGRERGCQSASSWVGADSFKKKSKI